VNPLRALDILFAGTLPPHPGGSAIANGNLLAGCARMGHRVRALAPMVSAGDESPGDAFAAAHPEIVVTRYAMPWFEMSPDVPAPESFREREGENIREGLGALIALRRPDVIIAGRETFLWHVPDVARAHGLPCVLMVHGCTTIGVLSGGYPEAMVQALLDQYGRVDLMVSPANHTAESLRSAGLGRVAVLPNGVDMELFSPGEPDDALRNRLGIGDEDIVVVHVSNLKPIKRAIDIVESAAHALREEPRLTYVIVGDGPCRAQMESACRQLGIAHRFRFTGWVEHDRVPDLVRLADIVVMPSDAETQALAYLEAQACGRLLIASDVAGAREVIVHERTGLLFSKGSVTELTAATLRAARDPQLRARIGQAARHAVGAHDLTRAVAGFAEILADVVGSGN
jgi:glycosyltransferase involved in cell wall biosynthesis